MAFVRFEVSGGRSRFGLCDSRFFNLGRGSPDVGGEEVLGELSKKFREGRSGNLGGRKENLGRQERTSGGANSGRNG